MDHAFQITVRAERLAKLKNNMSYPPLPPGRSRIHVPLLIVVIGALGAIALALVTVVWAVLRLWDAIRNWF